MQKYKEVFNFLFSGTNAITSKRVIALRLRSLALMSFITWDFLNKKIKPIDKYRNSTYFESILSHFSGLSSNVQSLLRSSAYCCRDMNFFRLIERIPAKNHHSKYLKFHRASNLRLRHTKFFQVSLKFLLFKNNQPLTSCSSHITGY